MYSRHIFPEGPEELVRLHVRYFGVEYPTLSGETTGYRPLPGFGGSFEGS